ncbi:MAG: hypothetical protein K8W52_13380 [Deltaproteobacteria bacterium]|nr:hypothetical protein [Deltaproteobacteria bacterium]
MRLVPPWLACLVVALVSTTAAAKPKASPKRYYFKLYDVTTAPAVAADVAAMATPRVKAQAEKLMGENPQLVVYKDGDPDPAAAAPAFTKWLAKQKLASGHKVSIQITDATEEVEQVIEKVGTQRIVVHVELHMFSETMPQRKMGFTGDGSSTIKLEIGKKVRLKDREEAWNEAAEEAMNKALAESLTTLGAPPPKPHK